jgi:hypothetical protein
MVRRREDGVAAVVRLAGADMRPRKERRGRRIPRACTHEGGREGKEKGAPFLGNAARVGAGREWRHVAGRHGGSAAVRWRGVVGSGPAATLTRGARAGGTRLAPKQGMARADQWAPATVPGGTALTGGVRPAPK